MEAEAKAITEECAEGIHAENLLEGVTGEMHNTGRTDSSSARALSQRRGPRRGAKHLAVQTMWVQHMSKPGTLEVHHIQGDENETHVDKTCTTVSF